MREEILSEIRRITAANGGHPPGRRSFERETGIRQAAWYGIYWARWGDALAEAGFVPNAKQARIEPTVPLEKLALAFRHYGRIPTDGELRMYRNVDPTFPSHSTVHNHFPTKVGMLDELATWLVNHNSFSDVRAMIVGRPTVQSPVRDRVSVEGSVYLMRSGQFYKIGRSDELERRVKEIRVGLPEAASLVHAIRTDDPAGIEAYWHRRFADRRANGEWFKLTSADIAAFRRRSRQ